MSIKATQISKWPNALQSIKSFQFWPEAYCMLFWTMIYYRPYSSWKFLILLCIGKFVFYCGAYNLLAQAVDWTKDSKNWGWQQLWGLNSSQLSAIKMYCVMTFISKEDILSEVTKLEGDTGSYLEQITRYVATLMYVYAVLFVPFYCFDPFKY